MRRLLLVTALLLLSLLVAPPARAAWVWPLHGDVITPYRNGEDPYAAGQHRGIDIAGAVGAPVLAAAGGEVRFAGTAGSSGLTVSVRTGDGFDTSYLHLSTIRVRAGEHVPTGGRIGAVGTSGSRSATVPHLHFGVREAGEEHAYRDPLAFLPAPPAAPQDPNPAPTPSPVPLAPVVLPAPAGAPAPGRVPAARRVPVRRRVPAGRRVPARRRVPIGHRVPAPHRVPARPRVPAGRRVPAHRRVPARPSVPARPRVPAARPVPDGRRVPMRERDPDRARGPAHPSAAAAADPAPGIASGLGEVPGAGAPASGGPGRDVESGAPSTQPSPRDGPDLGWALACAGLLLAAGILALNSDSRQSARRGRARLGAAIRPLVGRR